MEFGRVFEPILAAKFSELTGLKVQQDYKIRIHKRYPFLRANLDRLILSCEKHPTTGVLELKTTNSFSVREWEGDIPVEWYYQIQYYLLITGYAYAYLQVYERDTCVYHNPRFIERDEALIQEMEYEAAQWWNVHILGKKAPESVDSDDVLLLYPTPRQGQVQQASLVAYADWSELRRIKSELKELDEIAIALEFKLKLELGEGEELWYKDQKLCTWKAVSQRRFDSKAFQAQDPEYYDSFVKPTTYRRFTVSTN